jgi:hypothetical protein
MQAAISHKFSCDFELGTQPWVENALRPGEFAGNPSLSITVSQYMISLHQRKVGYLFLGIQLEVASLLTTAKDHVPGRAISLSSRRTVVTIYRPLILSERV